MARTIVNVERLLDRTQRWVFIPLIFACLLVLILWTVDPIRTWLVGHGWLKDVESINAITLIVIIFVLVSFDQRLARTMERLDAFSPSASSQIFKGGVSTIYNPVREALDELGPEAGSERVLDVLGLTLFTAWPILIQPKLADGSLRDWEINIFCLSSEFIETSCCFPTDWLLKSRAQLSTIQTFANDRRTYLQSMGVTLSVSKYDFFPAIHGFRTGAGHLFISYIHWADSGERLEEPTQFYEVFRSSDQSVRARVYRELFNSWIERAKKQSADGSVVRIQAERTAFKR